MGGGVSSHPARTAVAVARAVDRRLRHGAAAQQRGELGLALRVRLGVVVHDVERREGLRREPAVGDKAATDMTAWVLCTVHRRPRVRPRA